MPLPKKMFSGGALLFAAGCQTLAPSNRQQSDAQPPGPPEGLQARCATALVAELKWTASTDNTGVAGYRISRDGVAVGTAIKSEFSDTTVSGSATYTYTVSAFDAAGNTASSTPLTVTTAIASARGDAPYCHSPVIESMTWHWNKGYTQANGSDLWSVTWGNDGNVYTFFGDGGGFGGTGTLGRSSFGIAMIAGTPPLNSAALANVYGGYNAVHPAKIAGKASSIIAVGPDFYAIGGIYQPADTEEDYPHKPSGSPNHMGIAASKRNAYSWGASELTFCSADAAGEIGPNDAGPGSFCPFRFVGYGKGNAGAPDGYVYILGGRNSVAYWRGGQALLPARTYLARVPGTRLMRRSAYRYFTGLDGDGHPMWSADSRQMQPIFSDRNPSQPGCGSICNMGGTLAGAVYNPVLKRYIGIAQGDYLAQTSFYDAPEVWGPWTVISYNNIDPASGTGGWANLGTAGGDSLGVHPVNAWTSVDGQTLWMTYSSNGTAPAESLFPPAGTAMDSFNLVSVDLN